MAGSCGNLAEGAWVSLAFAFQQTGLCGQVCLCLPSHTTDAAQAATLLLSFLLQAKEAVAIFALALICICEGQIVAVSFG